MLILLVVFKVGEDVGFFEIKRGVGVHGREGRLRREQSWRISFWEEPPS
jgi:hypothetical protein